VLAVGWMVGGFVVGSPSGWLFPPFFFAVGFAVTAMPTAMPTAIRFTAGFDVGVGCAVCGWVGGSGCLVFTFTYSVDGSCARSGRQQCPDAQAAVQVENNLALHRTLERGFQAPDPDPVPQLTLQLR